MEHQKGGGEGWGESGVGESGVGMYSGREDWEIARSYSRIEPLKFDQLVAIWFRYIAVLKS